MYDVKITAVVHTKCINIREIFVYCRVVYQASFSHLADVPKVVLRVIGSPLRVIFFSGPGKFCVRVYPFSYTDSSVSITYMLFKMKFNNLFNSQQALA